MTPVVTPTIGITTIMHIMIMEATIQDLHARTVDSEITLETGNILGGTESYALKNERLDYPSQLTNRSTSSLF